MRRCLDRSIFRLFLLLSLFSLPLSAQAVMLGKIEISSHLGEPFSATIPLILDQEEDRASLYIELASAGDYQQLGVARDRAITQIAAEIIHDGDGLHVELSSSEPIYSPAFQLVLEARYQLGIHFKKMTVLLDPPPARRKTELRTTAPVVAAPLPAPSVAGAASAAPAARSQSIPAPARQSTASQPQDQAAAAAIPDWARVSHYGPIVAGDRISTIVRRVRKDERFTVEQVEVAILRRNPEQFAEGMLQMPRVGKMLEMPTSEEVARIAPADALTQVRADRRKWSNMLSEPRYAAIDRAQRERYRPASAEAEPSSVTAMPKAEKIASTAPTRAVAPPQPLPSAANKSAPQTTAKPAAEIPATAKPVPVAPKSAPAAAPLPASAEPYSEQSQAAQTATEVPVAVERPRPAAPPPPPVEEEGGLGLLLPAAGVLLLAIAGFFFYRRRSAGAAKSEEGGSDTGQFAIDLDDVPMIEVEAPPAPKPDRPKFAPVARPEPKPINADMPPLDAIPELTDHDTGEMEPFGDVEEAMPDPNIDYMAEVEIYQRYAMEDEALRQVQMAIRQKPGELLPRLKYVELLSNAGNVAGIEQAMRESELALAPADYDRLLRAVADIQQPSSAEKPVSPPVPTSVEPPAAPMVAAAPAAVSAALDFGELEMPGFEFEANDEATVNLAGNEAAAASSPSMRVHNPTEAASEHPLLDDGALNFDFGEIDLSSGPAGESLQQQGSQESASQLDDLSFDIDALLQLGDEPASDKDDR